MTFACIVSIRWGYGGIDNGVDEGHEVWLSLDKMNALWLGGCWVQDISVLSALN